MEKRMLSRGNCMCGCKHQCHRELFENVKDTEGNIVAKTHIGYEHYCDIDSPNYKVWHERNGNKVYEEYKKDVLDCYEANEVQDGLNRMIHIATEILEKLN